MAERFEIIALDADDTLWHNERLFVETQARFQKLLAAYHDAAGIDQRLYDVEKRNLKHFGYGIKGFTLSMIETAIELTDGKIDAADIQSIIDNGRAMLDAPIELLDGVAETVVQLADRYRLMLVTKGDLFDQETKLARSRLGEHFSAIEIVSEKNAATYESIMRRHGVEAARFVMVGNSLKSDILPALKAGAAAVYIPHDITWIHEQVPDESLEGYEFVQLHSIRELPAWLESHK